VRWKPGCEDVSPGAKEHLLLEDVTKQRSEVRGSILVCVKCTHGLWVKAFNKSNNKSKPRLYSHSNTLQCIHI
jgi:hypothetical protein